MKKYIITLLVGISSLFVGCTENEGAFEMNDFCDYSIISSAYTWFTSTGNIEIGTTVEFMNLSKGNSNYFWEIQEGAYFLYPDYVLGSTDFTPYIIPDQESYIRDTKAYVLFTEPGTYDVRVYNEFDEYVYYDPAPSREDLNMTCEAVYNRHIDKWVTDDSFTITVIDSVGMKFSVWVGEDDPRYFERNFEYDEDTTTWEIIDIYAGESVEYQIEETYGYPTSIRYKETGGSTSYDSAEVSEGSVATVTYSEVGEYTAGEITLSRSTDDVKDVSSSSTTIYVPLIIRVSESLDSGLE